MPPADHRLVLDTNVLLRGLLNSGSAAGRVVTACDSRHVVLVLSRDVLAEYRTVLTFPSIVARYPEFTGRKVEITLRRLRYVADVVSTAGVRFEFPRDPKDAKLVELAIAARATYIVTGDQDLLSLPGGRGDASKRFRQRLPGVVAVTPAQFLDRIGPAAGGT